MKRTTRQYRILIAFILVAEITITSMVAILYPIPAIVSRGAVYGSMSLTGLLFVGRVRIEKRLLLFLVVALISLLLSETGTSQAAFPRLGTWLLLISTVGPLFYSKVLIRFREELFKTTLLVFIAIGVGSFGSWLTGIGNIGRGHFSGVMAHSMLLAPVASLGGLYSFYLFINAKGKKKLSIYAALSLINGLVVILASSRSALMGFLFGILILLFSKKFKYKIPIIFATILLLGNIGFRMDNMDSDDTGALSGMVNKGTRNSRESLWNDRIGEYKDNPIFGVGFASQARGTISDTGNVEPGSSYLAVLSMTGTMGGLFLMFFFLRPLLSRTFWNRIAAEERYKLAAYGFFSIHLVAEGYLLASGSLFCFVFWTLVGSTYPYPSINYKRL